jgi:hypothetical protein
MGDNMDNDEIFEEEFIKLIDLKKVSLNFQEVKSFEELKENKTFYNLFKNIAEMVYIEDLVDNFRDEFITDYARDIFLITKWDEHLKSKGKSIKLVDRKIDMLANFYVTLLRYVGENLHNMESGDREVFEVWIIKSGINPEQIKRVWKTINEFYKFLDSLNVDYDGYIFDEDEMHDLQRVAWEFLHRAWGDDDDYIDWREKNILYYM